MTYDAFIRQGTLRLAASNLEYDDATEHLRLLVADLEGLSLSETMQRLPQPIPADRLEILEEALVRRLAGEPLQYITGIAWFWKSKFQVGPGVLIPRPDTEVLVEQALVTLPPGPCRVAELGAGSGAIGISLCLERPLWQWDTWELNPQSLPYLETNRKLLPAGHAWRLHAGDFFQNAQGPFDAIVSNPPYLARRELAELSREVQAEPALALDGGESGLDCLVRLVEFGKKGLAPGGHLLLETGWDQGPAVRKLLAHAGYQDIRIVADLGGRDRVAIGKRP